MAQRLTGEQAKAWLAANPGASYIDNKTGQTVTGQQTGLQKFAMGISQPFRAGAGIAQEAGYTLADLYNLMKGNNQEVGKRPEQYLGMTKEESQALYEDPLKVGLKAGAGVASYGLGGGKAIQGANTAVRVLKGAGRALPGGLLGGFGYSREGQELGDTLKGGAIGAVLGGALQGVSEIGRASATKATKPVVNEKLIKGSAAKVKMTPDEFTTNTRSTLQDMADNGFDVSSPKKIANSYPEYLNTVQKRVSSASQLAEGTPDLTELKTVYSDMIQDLKGNSGTTSRLRRLSEELFAKPNPTYDDIINYKMAVDKLGGGSVAVQKAGKSVTSQLMNAIRDETRSLASNDAALDTVLNQFNTALKLKDTVLKNPEVTQMFGIGGVLPIHSGANMRPVIDALRPSGLGQKIAQGPIGKTQQFLGKMSTPAQRAIPGMVGLGMQSQPQSQDAETTTDSMSETQTPQQMTVQDALIMAMQTMPNGSESELMNLAKMFLDSSKTETGKDADTITNVQSAIAMLDQYGGKAAGKVSTIGSKVGEFFGSATLNTQYRSYISDIRTKMIKQIAGTAQTPAEMKNLVDRLPQPTDEPAVAKVKLQVLLDSLQTSTGTQVDPNLESAYNSWSQ